MRKFDQFFLFFLISLSCLAFPSVGQPVVAAMRADVAVGDTLYVFRFVSGDDMFYIPWVDNNEKLNRLVRFTEHYRDEILGGRVPVEVCGYCTSMASEDENLKMASVRSNRVKSELITRVGLTETCFVTRNYAIPYEKRQDVVVVRLRLPMNPEQSVTEVKSGNEGKQPIAVKAEKAVEQPTARPEKQQLPRVSGMDRPNDSQADKAAEQTSEPDGCRSPFSLRANLLSWVTLTPDLGIEYRIGSEWSVLVNGAWTSWSWKNKDRRYALWNVSPEVRYYFGNRKRGYLGVRYQVGGFNYKLSRTGRQGDYMGGGITGGYLWEIAPDWGIDFHLAAGYTRAKYDKYQVTDGVRTRTQSGCIKNYWGINGAGVTLVWKIGK